MRINGACFGLGLIALGMMVSGCTESHGPDADVIPRYNPEPYTLEYGNLPTPSIPQDNSLRVEAVKLGRMLFYEKRISRNHTISCASCHVQADGFSDSRRFSLGVDQLPGKRQAMATFNMAWNSNQFFWDGRADRLRDQVLMPIQDHLEMDASLDNVVRTLEPLQIYKDQFLRAFGTEQVTNLRIALALEQFLHSIVSKDSKYDQYLDGTATLTASEERGRELFFAEYNPFFPDVSGADCQHCHSGRNFENDQYLNNGLDSDVDFVDFGRELATGLPQDRAKFKVPTLRNIGLTAPYMHDGRFNTLEEVVDHYNTGIHASTTLDVTLANTLPGGLMLTQQDKADIVAFLHTLTDERLRTNPAYSSPF